jgi:hypothetical protein
MNTLKKAAPTRAHRVFGGSSPWSTEQPISESAVELQCEEIQGKLTTFISNLKNAQDNILYPENDPPMRAERWCIANQQTKGVPVPTHEQLAKQRKMKPLAMKDIVELTPRECITYYPKPGFCL